MNFAEDPAQGHQETANPDGLAEVETMVKVADVKAVVLNVIMKDDTVNCLRFCGYFFFFDKP